MQSPVLFFILLTTVKDHKIVGVDEIDVERAVLLNYFRGTSKKSEKYLFILSIR